MREKRLTLGRGLAIVKNQLNKKEGVQRLRLHRSEASLIEDLCKRAAKLRRSSTLVERILQDIPETSCQSERHYLATNTDFYLVYLIVGSNNSAHKTHCNRLAKHLNDCFRCFESFSEVLRDFYYQYQDLPRSTRNEMNA